MAEPICIDCKAEGIQTRRPAPHPGKRCATHHRLMKRKRSEGSWARRIEATYGITAEEYAEVTAFQGGVCACCQVARGVAKRLSVDHSHKDGCYRGNLCGSCNVAIGRGRDDPEYFRRIADYLENPPAQQVLGRRVAPIHGTSAEKYRGGKPRKRRTRRKKS